LNVDREFIPALEAAFGRAMHAVVLNNTALAAEIFQTLTENKLGQAALAIPEWSTDLPDTPPSTLPKGALAWAIEKVEAPDALVPLVRRLLHDVVIVPDLAAALRLKKRTGPLQYATLGGEFISADGIIFGGSTTVANDSLLGRKTILDNLSHERDLLEAERQTLIDTRNRAQEQVEAAIGAVEEARRSHETAQQNHSQASVQIFSAERAVQDAEQKLTNLQTEKGTLEQQTRSADEKIAQLETELGSQQKTFDDELARKSAAELARENARSQEEEAAEKLNELRLAVATERQRHESLKPSSADGRARSGAE